MKNTKDATVRHVVGTKWLVTYTVDGEQREGIVQADDWATANVLAQQIQREARLKRRTLCTGDVVTPMTSNAYADRIGVKRGTLKRWLSEGMPAIRDWGYGPPPGVRIIPIFADAWISEHHGDSVSFCRRSWVYFAQRSDTGAIKIGFSSDPRRRATELRKRARRTAPGVKVTLLGQFPGDKPEEQRTHKRFAGARIVEEWFRPVPGLLDFIEDRCGDAQCSRRGA